MKLLMLLPCFLIGMGHVTAQTSQVTGVVISGEDNEPIIGASVLVVSTTMGATTDIDGKFVITNVPSSAKKIRISFIGFKPQEINIVRGGAMKVVMEPDTEILEEVVITGMTKVDKRLFTGAADQLTAADVKLDGMADISRGLEGRSAGV